MLLAWGDLFYSINSRAVTLSPVVIGVWSISLPTYMGGDTTICSHLYPVLYHGLDWLILHFSVLLILEEATLK